MQQIFLFLRMNNFVFVFFFLSIYATVLCYQAEQVFFCWIFYFFVSLGLKLVFNPELKNLNLIQNKQKNKNNIFSKIIEQDCWLQ